MAVDPLIARGVQPLDVSNSLVEIARMREAQARTTELQRRTTLDERQFNNTLARQDDDDAREAAWAAAIQRGKASDDFSEAFALDPQATVQYASAVAQLKKLNSPQRDVRQVGSALVEVPAEGDPRELYRAPQQPQQYAPETFSTFTDANGKVWQTGSRGSIRPTDLTGKVAENLKDSKAQDERARAEQAWNMYETAMTGLQGAMSGTVTGPVFGRVPAFSAGQQTADGAVAAMAPILKQLFRTAGEGTFTDKDQQLLLQMVPTRADRLEAREAKIANINAIVRAKLGLEPAAAEGGGLSPEEKAELEELRKRFKGR